MRTTPPAKMMPHTPRSDNHSRFKLLHHFNQLEMVPVGRQFKHRHPPPAEPLPSSTLLKDLDDEQECDPSMFEALSSWASKVHVKPIKKQRTLRLPDQSTGDNVNKIADWIESKKTPADEDMFIRSSKDLSRKYGSAPSGSQRQRSS